MTAELQKSWSFSQNAEDLIFLLRLRGPSGVGGSFACCEAPLYLFNHVANLPLMTLQHVIEETILLLQDRRLLCTPADKRQERLTQDIPGNISSLSNGAELSG